jgi:hypothetical protein
MSYFIRSGNTFSVSDDAALDIHQKLPSGTYIVKQNPNTGALYLEMIENFKPIAKLYGDTTKNADRILNTFFNRSASTGVMLTGEKGSGKSLLAKELSIIGYSKDIPTIVINFPWHGDVFNKFMQDISQEAIVLFDEFEKVYDSDQQESILTLLDGVFPSKKLFMFTCNNKWRVDSHMRNRPGRIFYMLHFRGLTPEFIREYCEDVLENKEHIDKVVTIASLFQEFNFDMLKALVEEMNRYKETPQEALRMLNANPEHEQEATYEFKLIIDGEELNEERMHGNEWRGNPLSPKGIDLNYYHSNGKDEDGDDDYEWRSASFDHEHLQRVDSSQGTFVFVDANKTLFLKKKQPKTFNYDLL